MIDTTNQRLTTVKEVLYWSYANLAMAHYTISNHETKYTKIGFMVRARIYKGLMNGSMHIGTILDDEKIKLNYSDRCAYCGSTEDMSIDHLLPKVKNGADSSDNFVRACKHCNSSKGAKDLITWFEQRDEFPPIFILRRYLKILISYCINNNLMEYSVNDTKLKDLPFDISKIPTNYPSPDKLILHK